MTEIELKAMKTIQERAEAKYPHKEHDTVGPVERGKRNALVNLERYAYIAGATEERALMEGVFKWLLGYYDFPEPPTEGRPRYYWRSHLRDKLKAIGIELEPPTTDGFPVKPLTPKDNETGNR